MVVIYEDTCWLFKEGTEKENLCHTEKTGRNKQEGALIGAWASHLFDLQVMSEKKEQ